MKSLSDLITSLEWGTKLHISVVFLGEHGNRMTVLPYSQHIHKTPACDEAKSLTGGFDRCFRCRNTVLRRVTRAKLGAKLARTLVSLFSLICMDDE